jgi:hypothetical protein
MKILSLLNPFYQLPKQELLADTTVYKVETRTGTHCGIISYQDDMVIWMRSTKEKPVKILKENIDRISLI